MDLKMTTMKYMIYPKPRPLYELLQYEIKGDGNIRLS